jgi:hypothetical protein
MSLIMIPIGNCLPMYLPAGLSTKLYQWRNCSVQPPGHSSLPVYLTAAIFMFQLLKCPDKVTYEATVFDWLV